MPVSEGDPQEPSDRAENAAYEDADVSAEYTVGGAFEGESIEAGGGAGGARYGDR